MASRQNLAVAGSAPLISPGPPLSANQFNASITHMTMVIPRYTHAK